MSFPIVLRRMMGLKDFRESYDSLLGLRMTMDIEILKWKGQWPNSKYMSAMLIILLRHTLFLTILLRCLHVICKSTCLENYIPAVMLPLNPTSLPSTVATFLATRLMAVLQPSGYSVFHGGDTPIQLSLPWQSCSCQCLNTETPSISYNIRLYKTSSYTVIR